MVGARREVVVLAQVKAERQVMVPVGWRRILQIGRPEAGRRGRLEPTLAASTRFGPPRVVGRPPVTAIGRLHTAELP